MIGQRIAKVLSANDIGATGGHQAGILVPKAESILAFFPPLDASNKNPDAWIECEDETGEIWRLRFVYYNNKLHEAGGTRNEYRLTYLTKFMRQSRAKVGDSLTFTGTDSPARYRIAVERSVKVATDEAVASGVIKLSGWRRIH